MSKIREMNKDETSNLKMESVECLVNVIEKYPDLVENNNQTLQ